MRDGALVCYLLEACLIRMLQFFGLQLDRGNIQNALTDNFLKDLHMTSNDYNNVRYGPQLPGHLI